MRLDGAVRRILVPLLLGLVVLLAFGAYASSQLLKTTTEGVFIDPAGQPSIPEDAAPATVNYVHDGDTLFLTTPADPNLKVRLLAVDTPELEDCYGDVATDFTRSLLSEGSTVYTLADTEPLDQYGRSLLFVWTADGELVNYSLVAEGMAEAVFIGENRLYEEEFERGEDEARDGAAGFWGAC